MKTELLDFHYKDFTITNVPHIVSEDPHAPDDEKHFLDSETVEQIAWIVKNMRERKENKANYNDFDL